MPPKNRQELIAALLKEGYSEEEAAAAAEEFFPAGAATEAVVAEEEAAVEPTPKYTPTDRIKAGFNKVFGSGDPSYKNVLHSGLNSALMGFLPQLKGIGADLVAGGKGYREAVDAERQSLAGIPGGQRMAGEVMGAMVPGGAAARAGGRLGRIAASAPASGAIQGAAQGLANSDGNVIDTAWDAGKGAIVGGATGAVASKVLNKALPAVADMFRSKEGGLLLSGKERAAENMIDLLGEGGSSIGAIRGAGYAPSFAHAGIPGDLRATDVGGPEFLRSARRAANLPRSYGEAVEKSSGLLNKTTALATKLPPGQRNIAAGTRQLASVEGQKLLKLADHLEAIGRRADADELRRQIQAAAAGSTAAAETRREQ